MKTKVGCLQIITSFLSDQVLDDEDEDDDGDDDGDDEEVMYQPEFDGQSLPFLQGNPC